MPGLPTAPEFSVANATFISLTGAASVTIRNVQIVNAPLGPGDVLPTSSLTCMLWMFDFPRGYLLGSGIDQVLLTVENSTIHLPADELEWFMYWLKVSPPYLVNETLPAGVSRKEIVAMSSWMADSDVRAFRAVYCSLL